MAVTNFATAIRTADTLIEVGRFLYEARTASRRSAEIHRTGGGAAASEHRPPVDPLPVTGSPARPSD
jgi:hypothetical protein